MQIVLGTRRECCLGALLDIHALPVVPIVSWALGFLIVFLFSKNYFESESYYFEKLETEGSSRTSFDFSAPVPPNFATNRASYGLWFAVFFAITSAIYILICIALESLKPDELESLV